MAHVSLDGPPRNSLIEASPLGPEHRCQSLRGMAEKHFDLAIVGSEYIEVTRNDVATANRLAHAVL